MNFFFTICSNNYLGQAKVLGESLKIHEPDSHFIVALVDEFIKEIDYDSFPFEVLTIRSIEPNIDVLADKYNIIELNTCVKPRIFEFLRTERAAQTAIYLDPDIKVYSPFEEVRQAFLTGSSIVLTPHIYTPIPRDGKTPGENAFLNFGIYNLGFIALRYTDESARFISWWKDWTYYSGYFNVKDGMFVDQLPINLAPIFFKEVHILNHRGYNMAPWNLHERKLSRRGDDTMVNEGEQLRFFHFSSFRLDSEEWPGRFYTRFSLQDRPDLRLVSDSYNEDLKQAGYAYFATFPCIYVTRQKKKQSEKTLAEWKKKPFYKRILIKAARRVSPPIKRIVRAGLNSFQ
jgi:hypothetical protein